MASLGGPWLPAFRVRSVKRKRSGTARIRNPQVRPPRRTTAAGQAVFSHSQRLCSPVSRPGSATAAASAASSTCGSTAGAYSL